MQVDTAIVLFDGVCVLCNGAARFAHARMKSGRLEFHPLQSERGQALLQQFELETNSLDTFVLVDSERCSLRSTAALRMLKYLRQPWPMLQVALLVPRPIRDVVYRFIAKRRYKWFGTCELPAQSNIPPDERENAGTFERTGAESRS